jgi:hypothetical protein
MTRSQEKLFGFTVALFFAGSVIAWSPLLSAAVLAVALPLGSDVWKALN